jgi:hypothetical protein
MESENRSKSWRIALIAAAVVVGAELPVPAQTPRAPVSHTQEELRRTEWRVMDVLAQLYGETDFSLVTSYMAENPESAGNPNIVFIPLSLGNVYLNRYEWRNHISDLETSIEWLEWVTGNHSLWGQRWLSAPVVSYLDLTIRRLESHGEIADLQDRIARLRDQALRITEEEADARLTGAFPYLPYDSCLTGDSKAEENAWEATLLAAAANLLPQHEHAAVWDSLARQLAYDAITRPSDPPDSAGVKTTTVTEDLALSNHGLFPNPTYAAAAILLLEQGALTYRLAGRDVPAEFGHNVRELYEIYRSYVDADLNWTRPSDPSGDATLFPFAFDRELEDQAIARRAQAGSLWIPTEPVDTMDVGSPLWAAVLNSKAVMFYMVGSYLQHFPPTPADSPAAAIRTGR